MRYLGIDFGSKRVGLAISDASNVIAVPLKVMQTSRKMVSEIEALCRELQVGTVVLGESNDYHGDPNPIMKKIEKFKEELEAELKLPVEYEPEILSSVQAAHYRGDPALLDASAAAIILQSYLDRERGLNKSGDDHAGPSHDTNND